MLIIDINKLLTGTTDSSISEEDLIPPPLPLKLRECDSVSSGTTNVENNSFLHSNRCSIKSSIFIKLQTPDDDDDDTNGTSSSNGIIISPPTPPPKPPKRKT